MQKSLFLVLCVSLSAMCLEKLDGVAAVVGDSIILDSEVKAYAMLKCPTATDTLEVLLCRRQALDELIEGKVLLVRAEKDTNITVSSTEIETELSSRIDYILKQNSLTLDQFETVLKEQQGVGLQKFKSELRRQVRQELLKQKVQQRYAGASSVSRAEVESFYKEYKDSIPPAGESVRLSLLKIQVTPSDTVRQIAWKKIKAIKDRLDNGESFDQAAKQYSEDPNAASGGDLGFVAKGSLTEIGFEERAFTMKVGDISDVFESHLGFHIITVVDKKDQMVHVKQIFVAIKPPAEQLARAQALIDSIRQSATSTQAFADAVRKFSTDVASRSRAGLLDWASVASLDPSIKQAIEGLDTGAISPVMQTVNSFSLYRLDDKKDSRPLTLEEDWSEISSLASRIYAQKRLMGLVRKWRQDTYVDVRL